ncbi:MULTISPECIES: tetratricopeptide repeat protein [unclassified Streptomyces]|uniref:tetratricopeptide repeat protein n=1 Tax=unclassified Streptomyces TaxID=2593676 RepID=UPI002E81CA3C|nr:tetratricopeptide repeat protein [Streptomyces sp. NBC_00589]WTI35354.1 tetratricopeptide repeat protein [Streptomyces sp. NBC_00775]WUB30972.1 tetratricopeptide repeat protein [Streptomyces sp. NBC_00589]
MSTDDSSSPTSPPFSVPFDGLWRDGRRARLTVSPSVLWLRIRSVWNAYWYSGTDVLGSGLDAIVEACEHALEFDRESNHPVLHGALESVRAMRWLADEPLDTPPSPNLAPGYADLTPDDQLGAMVLLHHGHTDEAVRLLQSMAKSRPDGTTAYLLALAVHRAGNPRQAYLHALASFEASPGCEHPARLCAELAGDVGEEVVAARAWAALGDLHLSSGDTEAALRDYAQALTMDPELSRLYVPLAELIPAAVSQPLADTWMGTLTDRTDHLDVQLAAAELAARSGRDDDALATVERVLRTEGNEPGVLFAAAQILLAAGHAEEALNAALSLRDRVPEDPRVTVLTGLAEHGLWRWADAEEALRAAHERLPDEPVVVRDLAIVLCEQGRFPEAEPLLDRAVELVPDDMTNVWVRAQARRRVADFAGAKADLDTVIDSGIRFHRLEGELGLTLFGLGEHEAALDHLAAATRDAPRWVEAWVRLGDVQSIRRNSTSEAVESYRKALRVDPFAEEALIALADMAMTARDEELLNEVVKYLREAVDRTSPVVRFRLGVVLSSLGDSEGARREVRRLLLHKPSTPEDYQMLAFALVVDGRPEDAVTVMERALALAPDDVRLHDIMGWALLIAGRPRDAEVHMVIAAEPAEGVVATAETHARLGAVRLELGKFAQAEESLRTTVEMDPDAIAARINLAEALDQQGRMEAALDELDEAVRRADESGIDRAQAHSARGFHLKNRDRLAECVGELEYALELDPEMLWARSQLCDAYQSLGRADDAFDQAERVLAEVADDAPARFVRGSVRLGRGEVEGGEADLRVAAEARPRLIGALRLLRDTLLDTDRADEAVELVRAAAEDEEATAGLVALYSETERLVGRPTEAIGVIEQTLWRWPEDIELRSALGWAQWESGRQEEALHNLSQLAWEVPEDPYTQADLGALQARAGHYAESIEAFRRATDLDPMDPWIWTLYCEVLVEIGAWTHAAEAGRMALAGRTAMAEAADALGSALENGSESLWQEALAAFELALRLKPADADAKKGQANVLYALGRRDEARAAYEKALSRYEGSSTRYEWNRGWCQYRLGRFDEAGASLRSALANGESTPSGILFDIALVALASQNDDEAEVAHRRAIRLLDQEPEARRCGLVDVAMVDLRVESEHLSATGKRLLGRLVELRSGLTWGDELAALLGAGPDVTSPSLGDSALRLGGDRK